MPLWRGMDVYSISIPILFIFYSILLVYSIFEDDWYTATVSRNDGTFQEIAVLRWDTHPTAFWRLPTKMAPNAGCSNAFNPFHFRTWDLTSTNRDQHPTFFQPLTRLSTGGPRRWCAVFRVICFSRPVYQASVSMLHTSVRFGSYLHSKMLSCPVSVSSCNIVLISEGHPMRTRNRSSYSLKKKKLPTLWVTKWNSNIGQS